MKSYSIYKTTMHSPLKWQHIGRFALFKDNNLNHLNEENMYRSIDEIIPYLKQIRNISKEKNTTVHFNFPEPDDALIQDNQFIGRLNKVDEKDIETIIKKYIESN